MKKNGKWGFINKSGEIIVPLEYERVDAFSDGIAWVYKDTKFALVNTSGEVTALSDEYSPGSKKYDIFYPSDYTYAGKFIDGVSLIRRNEKSEGSLFGDDYYGFIDKSGKVVISPIYDDVCEFENGFARVRKDDKWGVMNISGNVIVEIEYDAILPFHENLAGAMKNEKWGYIDTSGKLVIELIYDSVGAFGNGLARVDKRDEESSFGRYYAFIDRKGNTIIPFDEDRWWYMSLYDGMDFFPDDWMPMFFSEGVASDKDSTTWGIIDTKGNVIVPFEYDTIGVFSNGFSWARKGRNWEILQIVRD